MKKRFVTGVAAACVMALGAQTATSSTGGSIDGVPPDLQLSGKQTQSQEIGENEFGYRPPVVVLASCGRVTGPPASPSASVPPESWAASLPDKACSLSAEGTVMGEPLEPADGRLLGPHLICDTQFAPLDCHWQSGGIYPLRLRLTGETPRKVRKALDDGKKVRAKVTVEATDAAGNVAIATRTIRLVK